MGEKENFSVFTQPDHIPDSAAVDSNRSCIPESPEELKKARMPRSRPPIQMNEHAKTMITQ